MNLRLLKCLLVGLSFVGMVSSGVAQPIEKGKSIQITATGIPETEKNRINGLYLVSADGFVTMPFVGKVAVAGLSDEKLAKALEDVFQEKEIYQGVRIQVISAPGCGPNDQETVIFGGQVKKPGPVPMVKNLTIHQAIQNAGGISNTGELKRVRLIRNGEIKSYELNQLANIPLQKGDAIEVTDKWQAKPNTP